MILKLNTVSIPGIGTFGELSVGTYSFKTVEREWLNNAPSISCIPEGDYKMIPYQSPRNGPTWLLENHSLGVYRFDTNHRNLIEIHIANWPRQVEGCIGVGKELRYIYDSVEGADRLGVSRSGTSMGKLRSILNTGQEYTIEIRRAII